MTDHHRQSELCLTRAFLTCDRFRASVDRVSQHAAESGRDGPSWTPAEAVPPDGQVWRLPRWYRR